MSAINVDQISSIVCMAPEKISGAILFARMNQGSVIDRNTDLGVFTKVVSYLSLKELHCLKRVTKAWLEALHTRVCIVQDIQIRTRLRKRDLIKVPRLSIGREIFQNQDPDGKILDSYFFMQLSRLGNQEKLAYLEKFSERQRNRIQTLELKNLKDHQVTEFFVLCPNVRSLTVISSLVTGSFLSSVSDQLEHLKLMGSNLQVEYLGDALKRFKVLRSLEVGSKDLLSTWLCNLSEESPLESLILLGDQLEDKDIAQILSKNSLKVLKIDSPNITGSFLDSLLLNQSLEQVEVSRVNIRGISTELLQKTLEKLSKIQASQLIRQIEQELKRREN